MLHTLNKTKKIGFFLFFLFSSVPSFADFNMNLVWSPATQSNSLSWEAFTTSTGTRYYIYRRQGRRTARTIAGWENIAFVTDETSFTDNLIYSTGTLGAMMTWSYWIRGVEGFTLLADSSTIAVSEFVHSVTRGDALGGQSGFGQNWTFEYKLHADAYMDISIWRPQTTISSDASGFATKPSTSPVKVILDYRNKYSAARSFEMIDSSWINEDSWDCRDSSGSVVQNGVYIVLMEAYDVTGRKVDGLWFTVPVDILRLMNLTTTGINELSSSSNITYDLNGDANVKILICEPGSDFILADSSGSLTYLTDYTYSYIAGDALPADPVTKIVDGTRIIKYFDFYRKYGQGITEIWAGKDERGLAADKGLYTVAISAADDYGNHAVFGSGDNTLIHTTISVDRTEAEVGDSEPPALVSIIPSSGAVILSSLDQLSFRLDDETGIDTDATTVTVTDPDSVVYLDGSGAVLSTGTGSGTSVTFTLDFSTPLAAAGVYSVRIDAQDVLNNSQIISRTFEIALDTVAPQFVSMTPGHASATIPGLAQVVFVLSDVSGISSSSTTAVLTDPDGNDYAHNSGAVLYYNTHASSATFSLLLDDPLTAPGRYTFDVTVFDTMGNSAGYSKFFDVEIETSPPQISAIAPSDGALLTVPVNQILVTLQDSSGVSLTSTTVTLSGPGIFREDGDDATLYFNSSGNSATFNLLLDDFVAEIGTYSVSITAVDLLGNSRDYTRNFSINIDTFGPSLVSIIPSSGAVLTQSVSQVVIVLSDVSGIIASSTTVILTDPLSETYSHGDGATLYYYTSGSSATYNLTLAAASSAIGIYTVRITAYDNYHNSASYTRTFSITTPEAAFSAAEDNFRKSIILYPQPTENGLVTIRYTLEEAATMTLKIYTLMGEEIYSEQYLDSGVGQRTRTWNLTSSGGARVAPGVYLYQFKSDNGTFQMTAYSKMVVVK